MEGADDLSDGGGDGEFEEVDLPASPKGTSSKGSAESPRGATKKPPAAAAAASSPKSKI